MARFIKSSKSRMTTDLVNLINQTKKDVENLRAFRRNSKGKACSKKSSHISPLADRSKDDAYGLSENKKLLTTNKSDKIKTKKRIANGSTSSRKSKVKSKQSNYQPIAGIIDLVSRNERCITQVSNDNSKNIEKIISRKGSHKRTTSIETSERSDTLSKNRFLVSKKYDKRMTETKSKLGKDSIKSYLGSSMKFGTSTSISKYQNNNTNINHAYTPTSTASHKINIRGSLLAKK